MPQHGTPREPHLPVTRVTPLDTDIIRVDRDIVREPPPPLRSHLEDWRNTLVARFDDMVGSVRQRESRFPGVPSVARVRLTKMAKSYRPVTGNPHAFFSRRHCPMIGAESGHHMLVMAHAQGLTEVRARVAATGDPWSDFHVSNIEDARLSDVEHLCPRSSLDAIAAAWESPQIPLQIRLFDFAHRQLNDGVFLAFLAFVQRLGITRTTPLDAGEHLWMYEVIAPSGSNRRQLLQDLAVFPSIQRVGLPPIIAEVGTSGGVIRPLQRVDFPPPQPGTTYPVVGLIDTGIAPDNDFFTQGWVVQRHHHVPTDYQHGTRVGSLLVHGRQINGNDPWMPNAPVRIVDVAVLGSGAAPVDTNALLERIEEAVQAHPDVRVWNLSLNLESRTVQDDLIGPITNKLDEIQRAHDIVFVIAGGNIRDPQRLIGWPPAQPTDNLARILVPADSALGITVGALAHIERANFTMNPKGGASPFNRHGPGTGGTPKPDLSHCAGNVDHRNVTSQTGIQVMNAGGSLTEEAGSSFGTPLVTATLGHLDLRLTNIIGQRPGRALLKGLIIHSAAIRNDPGLTFDPDHLLWKGFGTPPSPERTLLCTEHEMTMIFEGALAPGHSQRFFKSNFPLPPCLYQPTKRATAAFFGEVVITVCCDPPLHPAYAGEYCSLHMRTSFGTIAEDGGFAGRMPDDVQGYKTEAQLIAEDLKWSPVKVYKKRFRGVGCSAWELRVEVQARDYYKEQTPQPFYVIVTVRDPEGRAPVYNQMFARMRELGWPVQSLVQQQIRTRV